MTHLGGVCDLVVHTQKDELSQSKYMGLTIYTKGNINLASYGQDQADVGAKEGKPVLGPKWTFWGLSTPWHLPNLPTALSNSCTLYL